MAKASKKRIPRKKRILTGERFGRWLVLEEAGINKFGATMWHCRCWDPSNGRINFYKNN